MKKVFLIMLFAIGLTTVLQAQTVTQSDAPGTTGSEGFISEFTFGAETVWLSVDTKSGQEKVAEYLPFNCNYSPSVTPSGNGWVIEGGVTGSDGHYYWFEIYTDSSRKVVSYTITRV